jgi:hypothetical protein
MKGCFKIEASPFFMDEQSFIAALRQLDINYILYVTQQNDPKCKHPKPDGWLEGYHQAVQDLSSYFGKPHES